MSQIVPTLSWWLSPKDYSYVQPVIKEAILKEQKEPKMAKDKAKKRSDIESKRAKKGQPKDIKEERFTKEAIKMPKHLDIFCISEKLLYMSVHVKTVDKNIRTFSLVTFSWWRIFNFRWIASNHYKFFNTKHIFLSVCNIFFSHSIFC